MSPNVSESATAVPVIGLPDQLRATERVSSLLSVFEQKYSTSASFLVRVPGRVNLIGEHIDYCGYSVFPMALVQDIMMAVGPSSGDSQVLIRLDNIDSQYSQVEIKLDDIKFPKQISWFHYFLCGYKGVIDKYCQGGPCASFNVLVSGTVPAGSGLSSSAAMVVASAMSTLISYYQSQDQITTPIVKLDIAQLCIESERLIGTDSGGMDQAIAVLAEEGSAKLIDFIPRLKATNVQLPSGVCFYVAHSGVSMHKAATSHYNTRVAETRLAAAVIAKRLNLGTGAYKLGDQLWVVQQASGIALADMGNKLAEIFNVDKKSYNKSDICDILEIDQALLEQTFLSRLSEPIEQFKLYQRAKHVYEEAARVHEFRNICESTRDVARLGQLMIASHESCRDQFECSHAKLDELVSIALRDGGAIGSRLTGAGWGGCTVSLVPEAATAQFEATLSKHCKFLVRSGPSQGAVIYQI